MTLSIIIVTGCFRRSLYSNMSADKLDSPDLSVKARAMRWVVDNDDKKSIPVLVDLLSHEDASIRCLAIIALKEMVKDDFGYDYAQPAHLRYKAIENWRVYLKDVGYNTSIVGDNE